MKGHAVEGAAKILPWKALKQPALLREHRRPSYTLSAVSLGLLPSERSASASFRYLARQQEASVTAAIATTKPRAIQSTLLTPKSFSSHDVLDESTSRASAGSMQENCYVRSKTIHIDGRDSGEQELKSQSQYGGKGELERATRVDQRRIKGKGASNSEAVQSVTPTGGKVQQASQNHQTSNSSSEQAKELSKIMKTACSKSLLTAVWVLVVSLSVNSWGDPRVCLRTYTTDADFDEGILDGVNHDYVHDQLQLNTNQVAFPYAWIANSGEGTVSKINTTSGVEEARYRTGPNGSADSPSRTAVDVDGNCWVANRAFYIQGSIAKILADGGVDRNTNGVIDTSTGPGDVKPWGEDERVVLSVNVGGADGIPRALAIDKDGDVWVGLYNENKYVVLDGTTGALIANVPVAANPHGPYGAAIDANGILWGSRLYWGIDKIDTSTKSYLASYASSYGGGYGVAVDQSGSVWLGAHQTEGVYRFDPLTSTYQYFLSGGYTSGRGVCVATNGNVWVALGYGWPNDKVAKYASDGTLLGTYTVGTNPCGVGTDHDGDIIVVCQDSWDVYKLRESDGSVIWRVPVGNTPYTYSDFTGYNVRNILQKTGTWRVILDSGLPGTAWGRASWTSDEPSGSSVSVQVRSANDVSALPLQNLLDVSNGTDFGPITGRYVEIKTRLTTTTEQSPILYDLTIQCACPTCDGASVVVDQNVTVDFNANPPSYSGDPDLLPYFSYDNSGPTPDTWKALFDVGPKALLITSNATITVRQVPLGTNNRRAPGIVIKSTCEMETEEGTYITVGSQNRQAGEIHILVEGNISINGVVSNVVAGTQGRPGKIIIGSKCGNIVTGPNSRIITYGQDYGGSDINIAACEEGDVVIDGLVDASYKGKQPSTIRIASFGGDVVIDGTTKLGEEVVAGSKRTISSGVSVRSRRDPLPGTILIQAQYRLDVYGSRLLSAKYPNYGAVAVKTEWNGSMGGLIDARSLAGDITAIDRAFDNANRFNTTARIKLEAASNIAVFASGSGVQAVVNVQGGDTGQGGVNSLRAFNGGMYLAPDTQVLSDWSGRPGSNGANLLTSCMGVAYAGGMVSPSDLNPGDDSGVCGGVPDPLFLDCSELGIGFAP